MNNEKNNSNSFGKVFVWICAIIAVGAIILFGSYFVNYAGKDITTCTKTLETGYSTITSTTKIYSKEGVSTDVTLVVEEKLTSNFSKIDEYADNYRAQYEKAEVTVDKDTNTIKLAMSGDAKEGQKLDEMISSLETDGYTCEKK